jgi:hypothetical protein
MSRNEEELSDYLKEAEEKRKPRARKAKPAPSPKRISGFRRWASSAAMDLMRMFMPVLMLVLIGGLFLILHPDIAIYFFYGAGAIAVPSLIYFAVDFYAFKNWTSALTFSLDGWSQVLNQRSRKFWDMNGEHWVPVKIVIIVNESCPEKHRRVLQTFLRKLTKRLNQWTVSKETRVGYSQPHGWITDDLVLCGDMNPRVMNLIRKRMSGEMNKLSRLMPGSILRVVIETSGKEKYHEVYHEPD